MHTRELYEAVYDAVRAAMQDEVGGTDPVLLRRMERGTVIFKDDQQRVVKELDVYVVFRKITAVREKLRVLEQKINNLDSLSGAERAELQAYLAKAYGSLTTFNFLFGDPADKLKGAGR